MKKTKTKSIVISFFLLALWLSTPLEARAVVTPTISQSREVELDELPQAPISYGSIKQYSSRNGTRVITRASDDNAYHVTCGYGSDNRSFFIVKNSSATKSFYTSAPINHFVPVINNHGFEIYDMVIYGDTCWFCGSYWYETGETGQTIFGEVFWVIEHKGFVGRFNVSEAINGSGTFYATTIDPSYEITHIAASDSTVLVLGNQFEGYGQFAVEMGLPSSGTSDVSRVTPPYQNEVFMDVTYTGDKYVILSRFSDSAPFMYFQYRFGLRYFKSHHLINIDTMYIYDTWQLLNYEGWFTGMDPIHLSATHVGDGVAISYVEIDRYNPSNTNNGHLYNIKINSKGAATLYAFLSSDTTRYTKIKDVGFGMPAYGNTSSNYGPDGLIITDDISYKTVSQSKRPVNSYSFTATNIQPTSKCGN